MEFVINSGTLQKELALVQGVVERKNTIPVLANILIESLEGNRIRITGTDLDVSIRCEAQTQLISKPGDLCVPARKLFEMARLLGQHPVHFKKEDNDWVTVKCDRARFKLTGVAKTAFPEIPAFKTGTAKINADVLRDFISRTIFAITQEESRYTLGGAKFVVDQSSALMVTTDGHRLAVVNHKTAINQKGGVKIDTMIPRKTLAELLKLSADYEGEIGFGSDENHLYFELGPRLLVSRMLYGQFPNWEMVMPKNNDKRATVPGNQLNMAIKRAALMADDRSHAVRFTLDNDQISISAQNADSGEGDDSVAAKYTGDKVEIGFNSVYLRDFLDVAGDNEIAIECKDSNSQAQFELAATNGGYDYKYIVMPMRL